MKRNFLLCSFAILIIALVVFIPPSFRVEPSEKIPIKVAFWTKISSFLWLLPNTFVVPLIDWMTPLPKSTKHFEFIKDQFEYVDKDMSNGEEQVKIDVDIYIPKDVDFSKLDVLVFFHGGGFRIGSPKQMYVFLSNMARTKRFIIICPKYRLLGPEGINIKNIQNDGIATMKWAREKFGHDKNLIVSGESAGGKLSIRISHYIAKNDFEIFEKNKILFIPIYPAVYLCSINKCPFHLKDISLYKYGCVVNERIAKNFNAQGGENWDYLINEKDLQNQARMLLIGSEYDYLKEEAKFYADKLKEYGVEASFHEFKGEIHGFVNDVLMIQPNSHDKLVDLIVQEHKKSFLNK